MNAIPAALRLTLAFASGIRLNITFGISLALAAAGTVAAADATPAPSPAAKPVVVACGTIVRSTKRGVAANHLDAQDFAALATGVTWFYNWFYRPDEMPDPKLAMEFLPMVWGDRPADLAGLAATLDAGLQPPPRAVLAINEPNLKGQAFIPPQTTAELYQRVLDLARAHHLPVVGPNFALGSAPDQSIIANDPLEKQLLTYTWFVPFLSAFRFYAGSAADQAQIGLHSYQGLGELKWAVETAYKQTGKPVWVTEFALWGADQASERRYMIQAVDWLERTPYVAGYAWFKERMDPPSHISLLGRKPGELTALGRTYIALPTYQPNVYWEVPGRIQAENNVANTLATEVPVDQEDGNLEVDLDDGGTLDLNLATHHNGLFDLAIRIAGTGALTITSGSTTLASVKSTGDDWQTIPANIALADGGQTLHLQASGRLRLDWIEILPPPGVAARLAAAPVAGANATAAVTGPTTFVPAHPATSADLATWDGTLRARVARSKGPIFRSQALKREVQIDTCNDDGLVLRTGIDSIITLPWKQLTTTDRLNLAEVLLKDGNNQFDPAGNALAAFYAIVNGDNGLATSHLERAGSFRAVVEACFN